MVWHSKDFDVNEAFLPNGKQTTTTTVIKIGKWKG